MHAIIYSVVFLFNDIVLLSYSIKICVIKVCVLEDLLTRFQTFPEFNTESIYTDINTKYLYTDII